DRGDRFEQRPRFGDRPRFGRDDAEGGFRQERFGGGRFERREGDDRPQRFDRGDRGDRFEQRPRFEGDKRPFKRFGGDKFSKFPKHTGPRARAFDERRRNDHAAYVQSQTVRLDADVAKHFADARAVNEALRQLIAIAGLVKPAEPAPEPEQEVQEPLEAQEAEPGQEAPAEDAEPADEAWDDERVSQEDPQQ
ncbi:MAG: hypothetical protein HUK26_01115, partial [Duodenibacillus sp.]|nr:hypothetical protein [Duodenibacillus sp.]